MSAESVADFDKKFRSIFGGKARGGAEATDQEAEQVSGNTAITKALAITDEIIKEKWHTQEREPFLTIARDGIDVQMSLDAAETVQFLNFRYFTATGRPMADTTRKQVVDLLSAQCKFLGPEYVVYSRVAHQDGEIWIDLGDETRRAVRISSALLPVGWEVVESATVPVRFRRIPSALPLPAPVAGGSLQSLRAVFPNIDEADWIQIVAWLVGTFQEYGGRAFLEILGGQGSGKSTLGRYLLSLIDPNEVAMRSMPKNEQDLLISVLGRVAAGHDNLSAILAEMADAFCRISSGAGISTRTLYSNVEETLLKAQLSLLWTAIEPQAIRRPDLQDRTISVRLEPIAADARYSEREISSLEEEERPLHLGALYRSVATALSRQDAVQIKQLPRLADFGVWVEAAAPAFGWDDGMFIDVLESSRAVASALAVDAAAIGPLLIQFMKERKHWDGTSSDLLGELKGLADDDTRRSRNFPKDSTRLSGQLRRLVQPLNAVGIWVGFDRSGRSRGITLDRNDLAYGRDGQPPSPSGAAQQAMPADVEVF